MPYDTIRSIFPQLEKAKGIICDFRGYTWGNSKFRSHLTSEDIKSDPYMYILGAIYPNRENLKISWQRNTEIEAVEPYLGDKEIIFIIDGRSISAVEDYMLPIKHYNLATIIGENSAGANGSYNSFKLLGDYTMWWTGTKITQLDGSQFHNIGIIPDVNLERTIDGIKSGKDESPVRTTNHNIRSRCQMGYRHIRHLSLYVSCKRGTKNNIITEQEEKRLILPNLKKKQRVLTDTLLFLPPASISTRHPVVNNSNIYQYVNLLAFI